MGSCAQCEKRFASFPMSWFFSWFFSWVSHDSSHEFLMILLMIFSWCFSWFSHGASHDFVCSLIIHVHCRSLSASGENSPSARQACSLPAARIMPVMMRLRWRKGKARSTVITWSGKICTRAIYSHSPRWLGQCPTHRQKNWSSASRICHVKFPQSSLF